MKRLLCLLALVVLVALPVQAGVSVAIHIGGYSGGYSGGHRGYSGASYAGRGYYGRSYGYGYGNGYYGGGYYVGYPSYGYDYGYAPDDDYSSIVSTPPVSSSPAVYSTTSTTPVYPYAPQVAVPDTSPPAVPVITASSTPPTTAAPSSMATGKVDESGLIHSPYTSATFKVDKVAPGQIFYDPVTGQPFTVQIPAPPPASAPEPAAVTPPSVTPPASQPAAAPVSAPLSAPTPSASLPVGKLDEFGYVHSPFSTFTFKVQNGNYAQVFRDPFTGQSFVVHPKDAPPPAVHPAVSAQASD